MMLTDYLIEKMQQNNIIKEDIDIYIYGFNNGFTIIINILTAIFISCIVKQTDILILLLISFIPLRSYCGGFHCKSRFLCYICSNIIITFLLIFQNTFCDNFIVFLVITLLSSTYLFIGKTNGSQIRILDNYEILHFTQIKRILLLSITFFSVILFMIGKLQYATTLMSSIILVAVLILAENVQKYKVERA